MPAPASNKATGSLSRDVGRWSWIVMLLTAAAWTACFYFPRVWTMTGIADQEHKIFLDLDGTLASGEAARLGIDPYLPNSIDFYRRPHMYTEWWLVTGNMGLTRRDTLWLGAVLAGAMLVSAVLLLRPRGWREGALLWGVLISPALLMAVNRGNNDIVAFILMCGAFALMRQPQGLPRMLAVLLLAVSAVLKYYPLAAAVLLLDARTRREWVGWILLYALVLVLAWPALQPGLVAARKYHANPEWLYAFGAPVIFRDFGLTPPPTWLLLGGALAVAAGAAWKGRKNPTGASADEEREFVGGGALIAGSFALGSSYAYKFIFALWLLPWLWRPLAGFENNWRRISLVLLYVVLWLEGLVSMLVNGVVPEHSLLSLRLMQAVLLLTQLCTWALVICLGRSVLLYTGRRVAGLITGRLVGAAGA